MVVVVGVSIELEGVLMMGECSGRERGVLLTTGQEGGGGEVEGSKQDPTTLLKAHCTGSSPVSRT